MRSKVIAIGSLFLSLWCAEISWSQPDAKARKTQALTKKSEAVEWEVGLLKSDVARTAHRIQDLRVRMAQVDQQLQAKAAQGAKSSDGYDWSKMADVDVVQDEQVVGEMFTQGLSMIGNKNITKAEFESIGSRIRPVIEDFVQAHPDSRWADDILLIQIWGIRDGESNPAKALQMLEQVWARRDTVRIEEEVKALSLYSESISIGRVERAINSGGLPATVNPVAAGLKQEMAWTSYKAGNNKQARQYLEDYYELIGRPGSGEFYDNYVELCDMYEPKKAEQPPAQP